MAYIKETLTVDFSAKQMYELVNDIEAYPEFVPACIAASVNHRTEHSLDAELRLQKAGFSYKLKTRNRLHPYERIDLELLSGPFTALHGAWNFIPQDEHRTIVELTLEFHLKNKLISLTLNKVFKQISHELITSFYQRAQKIYG